MDNKFKYYAFISYSSHDTAWGKRLQRKLENYRMPTTLCSKHGWESKPMKPVFFAPTDIQPGGLTTELQERLKASRYLIVICSPHSAQSEWVGKEIAFFHGLGRTDDIHFFIVDGTPHSGDKETECFNPVIEEFGLPEILGANIHEKVYRWPWMNRERAYVQLITKLLGVEFDTIWQRHKRRMVEKMVAWILGTMVFVAVLTGVWVTNQPVDVSVRLNEASEHNTQLPPLKEAVVTITLANETKQDTIESLDDKAIFTNVPHRFLNKEVHISVCCKNYLGIDTTLVLSRNVTLNVFRDASVYGNVHFRLWNPDKEEAVGNYELRINGRQTSADEKGMVFISIPLKEQKPQYHVSASIPLENDMIYMPCGEDDVILIK